MIVVIGGGVTGLAAAHKLAELGYAKETVLLEASGRLGGALRSERRGDFLLEHGPDAFLTEKPWALDLCRRAGIGDDVIGTNPDCRRSFILRNGRLHAVPEGFYLMAPAKVIPFLESSLLSWRAKIRLYFGDRFLVPRRTDGREESLAQFVTRRFGSDTLNFLAQPLVAGITTANPEKLSLEAVFPKFIELERKYGSVIKGLRLARRAAAAAAAAAGQSGSSDQDTSGARYGLFATLKNGMQGLVDAVAGRLNPSRVRLNTPVDSMIPFRGGWEVYLPSGRPERGPKLDATHVIVALPAWGAAEVLATTDADLTKMLRRIPYASTLTVNLAYDRYRMRTSLAGMGFVVPAAEKRRILACTYASTKFAGRAPADKALLRVFMGGACRPELAEVDDAEAVRIAAEEASLTLAASGPPLFSSVARHPRSLAQFHLGHKDRVAEIRRLAGRYAGLILAGNYFEGGGIPNCVHAGEQAAEAVAADLAKRADAGPAQKPAPAATAH